MWVDGRGRLTEVVAVVIDLRVVGLQHSGVGAVVAGDQVAVVARLDRVGLSAICTGLAQADNLTGYKVGAAIIDGFVVGDRELVAVGRDQKS